MIRISTLAALPLIGSLLAAMPVAAQSTSDSLVYTLASPPSDFEWGCFDPCACPILVRSPLRGSFVLVRSHTDPLYAYYDVVNVRWGVPDATYPVAITGSGTYRRGGEFALMEQLTLDLSFDGGPPQRFDSGLKPPNSPFPEINTRISLHEEFCHDSVVAVDAKPAAVAAVTGPPLALSLAVAPNPFRAQAGITFVLARDDAVELGVFDIVGRRVRALAPRASLARGSHERAWDGRLDDGLAAAPGLYVVRLDGSSGSVARTVVRLP